MSYPKKLTSSASFSPSIRISLRLKIHQAQAKNFCRVLDIRVTQVMHTGVRCVCFGCDLLVMCIKALRVQVVAEHVCENEPTGGVLFGGVYPVLPQIAGL